MAQIVTLESSQFHPGEQAIQHLLRIPHRDNPTHYGLPLPLAYRIAQSPLVAFGTLDRQGRPWATIWGGEAGFCQPVAQGVLGVRATADARHDPVLQELLAVEGETSRQIIDDAVVTPEEEVGGGKLMAGLSIDLATRDRVKIAGRMAVGTATRTEPGLADLQLAMRVEESLGNCPKYLNKKRITPHIPKPQLVSEGAAGIPLPQAALDLIARADLFFIASKHSGASRSMDVNHRGGAPGFVRVLRNGQVEEEGGGGGSATTTTTLVFPEFSGNRLYQTLGNLHTDPLAGLVFPDFASGDVLYLTGRATVLAGAAAAACMPRAKLAVRVDVAEARLVRDGLPFRGAVVDYSPYNPAVRRLAAEKEEAPDAEPGGGGGGGGGVATATLVRRERLTPTISRYVFKIRQEKKRLRAWRPGHHVTLDFAGELDAGYSHMRDDDPQSLNDDFVRTFTVSRPVDPEAVVADADGDGSTTTGTGLIRDGAEPEFEITVRRHGPATGLLERWNTRVPLEIPVLGFGGAEGFLLAAGGGDGDGGDGKKKGGVQVFIAAGVGITPLMAQAAGVLAADGGRGLRVLWSLKGEDLPLAVDVLERIRGLGSVTKLFVTGEVGVEGRAMIATILGLGAEVLERRIGAGDVLAEGEKGSRKYYCCTGPDMMKTLLKWTGGEEVAYESFEY
ncbi:hypothetical protein F4820DRAFT_2180 [Hypoxylon rubiginosum]|uniref:Uncharacterized protein n=1 Tax=Hypoxylon rubiginosum TaxID=110542 RepID=A0ACB9ZGW4_9PEZI|nr:hypothetical protein F4820DRAFT_2180 [Hypoxylon rubiginosum]